MKGLRAPIRRLCRNPPAVCTEREPAARTNVSAEDGFETVALVREAVIEADIALLSHRRR